MKYIKIIDIHNSNYSKLEVIFETIPCLLNWNNMFIIPKMDELLNNLDNQISTETDKRSMINILSILSNKLWKIVNNSEIKIKQFKVTIYK